VARAPVSVWHKLQMGSILARRAFWNRRMLARELGMLLTRRSRPRRARPRPGGSGKPFRRQRAPDSRGSHHPT
jgi:hypothetical protein